MTQVITSDDDNVKIDQFAYDKIKEMALEYLKLYPQPYDGRLSICDYFDASQFYKDASDGDSTCYIDIEPYVLNELKEKGLVLVSIEKNSSGRLCDYDDRNVTAPTLKILWAAHRHWNKK